MELMTLKDEILTAYPHRDTVSMREVNTAFFVRWCGLNYNLVSTLDVQTAAQYFKEWILEF